MDPTNNIVIAVGLGHPRELKGKIPLPEDNTSITRRGESNWD